MPTKQDYIDALSLETSAKEIKRIFDDKPSYSKKQWLAELESDNYAGVRYYYYYWRRSIKNPKTFVRGNKIVSSVGANQ